MRAFFVSLLAVLAIALAAILILDGFVQEPVSRAFSTSAVRL
jgi:hypothetical protein